MIQENILKTIFYFDLFDYPLTTFEIWKWLWSENGEAMSYGEVEHELAENPEVKKYIVQRGSFWCLKGREDIVAMREERYRLAIAKLQRARRIAHLFSYLPWIEGIAACNSLGYRNASAKSDIDFFIITQPGTIWLVRFLTVGLMALAGIRPTEKKIADTICLSFFVSSDAMSLEKLRKIGGDPYLTYWTTQLTSLYGRGDIWQKFWDANAWVKKFLPNALPITGGGTWLCGESLSFLTKAHDRELLSNYSMSLLMNNVVERWQILRFPQKLRELATVGGTDVVVNDQVLKFHDNDRRDEYREQWLARLGDLGVFN